MTNSTVVLACNRESGSSHQRHSRQHNDRKVTSLGSLLDMPVKLSNGIADKKTTIKLTYTRSLWALKLAAREVLHGEQNINSSQQVWYVGIQ